MPRQNWRAPTTTSPQPTPTTVPVPASCSPFTLHAGYTISLSPESTLTLSAPAIATPECFTHTFSTTLSSATTMPELDSSGSDEKFKSSDLRDPFYASTIPMAYSISATTTLAYVLLFLLFLPNPPNSRPWLQKVATLTVVVCLTIAFAETTTVLEEQYHLAGSSLYSLTNEAREVRRRVVAGTFIKIGRIVSDLFLWLAQVQTLIRLFPREREKVIIKWAGFCLILLDTIFSILQTFVSPLTNDPESFLDAIPALSYLFQIALSLLYASCVIYYSFAKRKYSYFYPHSFFTPSPPASKQYGGRSIVLVATLSIASVLTPIVFFVLDIAQKDLAGWGDYIRWVGAASASAVVWEWVDRIEGLEREESKCGVLGREVFDEDEDEDGFVGNNGGGSTHRRDDRAGGLPLSRATTVTSATGSTSYAVNVRRVDTETFAGLRGTRSATRSASAIEEGRVEPDEGSQTTVQSEKEWDAASRSTTTLPPPVPAPSQPPATAWSWRKRRRRETVPLTGVEAPLPVTIIPAPPRGAQGSWGAVERARAMAEAEVVERAARVELPPSRSTFRAGGSSVGRDGSGRDGSA